VTLTILSPAGNTNARAVPLAPRAGRPGRRPIYLFSNNKPNVDRLFDDLAACLRGAGYAVVCTGKANAAAGCPEDLLGLVARDAGWVVNAVGD
jgi:hypothetical protein